MSTKKLRQQKGRAYMWLLEHIHHRGEECLIWPSYRNALGYAQVWCDGKTQLAHRIMCRLAHGQPPTATHQAAHNCGNGRLACVNPVHLSWKTNSENQKDRRRHGTHRGGRGPRTILSLEQIAEIR